MAQPNRSVITNNMMRYEDMMYVSNYLSGAPLTSKMLMSATAQNYG